MARSELLAAFPLAWPVGWPRHNGARKAALFGKAEGLGSRSRTDITMQDAMARVHYELGRLGVNVVDDCVISTNLKTNMAGFPRSDQGEPDDPGAAVYWQRKGKQTMETMAIDTYTRTRDNVAAIAATLNAMRKIERNGGAQILERAFAGFTALPKPSGADWWEVLKLPRDATRAQIRARYMELAQERHPDKPNGSDNAMAELNRARDQALQQAP